MVHRRPVSGRVQELYQLNREPLQELCLNFCVGTLQRTALFWLLDLNHHQLGIRHQRLYQIIGLATYGGPWR